MGIGFDAPRTYPDRGMCGHTHEKCTTTMDDIHTVANCDRFFKGRFDGSHAMNRMNSKWEGHSHKNQVYEEKALIIQGAHTDWRCRAVSINLSISGSSLCRVTLNRIPGVFTGTAGKFTGHT
jgi:hypothetical protein